MTDPNANVPFYGSSDELAPLWSRIHQRIGPSPGNYRIDWLLSRIESGELNVDPPYQRGRVWTREQSEAFAGFFIEGNRVPAFYVRQRDLCGSMVDEVVDGKQRLLALKAFVDGEIDAVLWSGERVRFDDLTNVGKRGFRSVSVPLVELPEETTDREVMAVYIRLNRGGTPHTAAEIDRVREMMEGER